MGTESEPSTELRTAAALHGPGDVMPAYARTEFPMVALPRVLRRFVREASDAMGIAPEAVATPILATCATAIGNTYRVRITDTWTEPSILWAITLMESGSLKTPAYNAAVEPLRLAQRAAEEAFAKREKEYRRAKAAFDNGTMLPGRDGEGDSRPGEPVEPTATDLFTSDSTVEALGILFSKNPRGLALTRDELSGFFSSFGAYKGGRGGDESTYLEFYNAGSIKLNRASGKRIYVHAAALSIFGTCQPVVFRKLISVSGKSNQIDNGMAARFIIAAPDTQPKRWRESKAFDRSEYHDLIGKLLSIPVQYDAEGHVQARTVDLTPAGKDEYIKFVNEHGAKAATIVNPALRFHYSKLEAVAARLALIFHLVECASGDVSSSDGVGACQVLSGIALARWYGREALRVYGGYQSEAEREKRELLEEVRAHNGSITLREVRNVRRRWRDTATAETLMYALAKAGYGEVSLDPQGPQGGARHLRFRLFDEGAVHATLENHEIGEVARTSE